MKCNECNFETIEMKYEHKEDGKLKAYYFCHTCEKQTVPIHSKISEEVVTEVLPRGFSECVGDDQNWDIDDDDDDEDWNFLYD
jgi:hypothetical protein